MLDLEKIRKKNRDIFEDETKTTAPSKSMKGGRLANNSKVGENSLEAHLNLQL